ncbi:hypothetical protein OH76DRAFT_1488077 [Lentinus brumalis]|uniref:MYND-type domain-containing protein n=1 Tax=Lentinus brumalis TaxID=2498619 RepID=A0A371CSE6_9APHY|nr:hypothetical protein OH76DRAFT_1488077 [Polyporus brumalis]
MHECSRYLTAHATREIGERFEREQDPEAILELGFRYLSGCGVKRKSLQGALYMFDMLADDFAAGSDYVGDRASAEIRAQAHSAAARAYWDEWCLDTDEARADDHAELHRFGRPFNPAGESPYAPLVFAAVHASHSVQLGLVSPAVLWVGFGVKDVVERIRGTDVQVTSTGEEVDWALEFRPLWDALKKRETEIVAKERRRRAKVAKNPGAYICAAEGCNVEGLHKAALRACGGGCSADLKPHYCSKECQKRVCRFARVVLTVTYLVPAGLAETQGGMQARRHGKTRIIDDQEKNAQLLNNFLGRRNKPDEELGGEWIEGATHAGPEHTIEVPGSRPGETIRLVSGTLQPTELRKLRQEIKEKDILTMRSVNRPMLY